MDVSNPIELLTDAGDYMAAHQSSIYIEYHDSTSTWHVFTDNLRCTKEYCRFEGVSDESLGDAWNNRKRNEVQHK